MKTWSVTLGLLNVIVQGENEHQARKAARLKLSEEWPRHYDMIMEKSDSEFNVVEIK